MGHLDTIHSPADVKALPESALPELAQEIRAFLIDTLSADNPNSVGGHLGPNLGVVELSIALHRVFNTPQDKLLFDVSHQAYVHKILTGRRERLNTIRQYGGLNGFLLRTESEHDCYGAGHAGTALSAALGLAVGRDRRDGDESVVCVAGDGAFTCGVTYEALNNVATSTRKLIVVLNDNEWSIARNVGAIAHYFNRIATHPTYYRLHEKTAQWVEWLGGRAARNLGKKVEEGLKNLLLPSVIFDELGLRYYGPIDGHDLPLLVRTFDFLRQQNEPVLLHVLTKKGNGYEPAMRQPDKFHGLGRFKHDTGETVPAATPTYSELFGKTLAQFADADPAVCAVTGAMPNGTGLVHFAEKHPDKYFDVGIAEEHAAIFASGLAVQGFRPFVAIYSTFMQRAYDMIVHDIALQNLPVAICMDRAGLSGDDGPTHHGLFDISFLRSIPGLIHMQPKDEQEFVDMLWTILHHQGPAAIRYPRGAGTGATPWETPQLLEIGKAEVVKEAGETAHNSGVDHGNDGTLRSQGAAQNNAPETQGSASANAFNHRGEPNSVAAKIPAKVALFGLGNMLELALEAASRLEAQGIATAVVNPRWIKPLDAATLERFAREQAVIVTLEDHVLTNGFGSAVLEHLADARIPATVIRIGWPDQFIEHGTQALLRQKHGLTVESVVAQTLRALPPTIPTSSPPRSEAPAS